MGVLAGALITDAVGLAFKIAGNYITCDQKWEVGGDKLEREIASLARSSAAGDSYPQGEDFWLTTIRAAQRNRRTVVIYAKHTFPRWTWYIEAK